MAGAVIETTRIRRLMRHPSAHNYAARIPGNQQT
jgi:hypothetical protein